MSKWHLLSIFCSVCQLDAFSICSCELGGAPDPLVKSFGTTYTSIEEFRIPSSKQLWAFLGSSLTSITFSLKQRKPLE